MLIIFESILPIFLLVILGVVLKRTRLINESFWSGLEQFGYFVLFPALLFQTLSTTDFSSLDSGSVGLVSLLAVGVMTALVLAIWPLLKARGMGGPSYTSVFQTSTRWNGFMALAIAEKLTGQTGLSVIAIIMASIIVPLNLINVGVMVWFSGESRGLKTFVVRIVTNPIIIGALLGVLVNFAGISIYAPVMTAVDLIASASLGLGLVTVGAGLRVADALKPQPSVLMTVVLKLLVFPAVAVLLALVFGLSGEIVVMIALGAAVPTAMNGYVLAKQMGGDADLYAAAATVQTVAAFFTIPVVLYLAGQAAGG
ncbi:MAG: AEC family transporter [Alphaproteobacteria bacterium]|jgi:predicted permease|uniref:AEC family transporter n=1 Tax=Rhizobium/Agrobacterium group TaxID=227290 RepID=UPI00083D742B|nr:MULTISPECIES: AEC family transporter [unclassified Agrobacterium]MBU0739997.1 AEC family transporter [Alphaproteobacteria bacterium]MDM7981119.1 AEC family transporter [Rhizobium sp.]AOG10353.1 membrane transport family protein [Agrobacterium sp. RAC06]MBU0833516.1 AEC family transporter [Alphaproteobacteria bacterium]MBU1765109.1 AEC family transporter [Alphaproteobacteria bacterium]